MDKLLPLLGCVIMCPVLMVVMMRGTRSKETTPHSDETGQLRAEVDQLRSELAQRDDATH